MTHLIDLQGHGMCADQHGVPVRLTPARIIDEHGNWWHREDGRAPGRTHFSHFTARVETLAEVTGE